jgi:hypothetical protein
VGNYKVDKRGFACARWVVRWWWGDELEDRWCRVGNESVKFGDVEEVF